MTAAAISTTNIQIITHSERIETLLTPFKDVIGDDFEGYRNHLYRVLTYTLHFLEGDEQHREVIETALVYHDISLWADKALAYVAPSSQRALEANQNNHWGHDPQLLHDLIFYHHKIFPFKGPNAKVVNAFRKADWIDATQGVIKKGMLVPHIEQVKAALPAVGFYDTLMRLGPELSGGNFFKMIKDFLQVYKW